MANLNSCFNCRSGTLAEVVRPIHEVELSHDNRKYAVRVENYHVRECNNCDLVQVDDDEEDRLSYALRDAAGLLQPEAIRTRREELGLKQSEMADALGVAVATLSRWETGGQIQQRVMDKILRAFFALPELRRFYGVAQQDGYAMGHQETSLTHSASKQTGLLSASHFKQWLAELGQEAVASQLEFAHSMAVRAISEAVLRQSKQIAKSPSNLTGETPNRTPNHTLDMAA